QKQRIAELQDSFHSLQDEELFKYCELFKKAISGRIGRTLFNMEFPLAEEREGGHQTALLALLRSGLKDEALVEELFQRIIDSYRSAEKYLILLVHGVYDIPGRTSDNMGLDDGSEDVYSFLELSVCPVELLRDGLCYDAAEQAFFSRTEDWGVQKPEVGRLYPAFNDRSTDLHAALWYAKNEKSRHDELAEELLGMELPRPESAEKDVFREVIEISLGDNGDFENVKRVNEAVNQLAEAGKEAGEPALIEKHDIRRILYDNGADEETIERFDEAYEELIGEDTQPLLADNIAESKKLTIQSDHLKLDVKPESAELIETRVIEGREYFLIPVTDNVTVNGIRLRAK
ncbi:MAG: DUF4317 domain-containing protein, partial [Lachnospiraceae bacterium]